MSMSTFVKGFRPPDVKWDQMKSAWDACEAAGIDIPDDVSKFFGYEVPDDAGIEIDLENHECCQEYNEDMRVGFQIDISKLPPNIKYIRFVNSY